VGSIPNPLRICEQEFVKNQTQSISAEKFFNRDLNRA